MNIFLYSLFYGVIAGLIYLLGFAIRKIFKNNLIITIFTDTIVSIAIGILFIYYVLKYNNGIIRAYEIIGFVCGFTILLISLLNIVAKFIEVVYNLVVNKMNKSNKKVMQNDKKQIEKSC